jgi:primosomal protein N' (replication factor Y)
VAGRAGRGSEPGEVIIQTFKPEHHAVQCALRHDYVSFYRQEITEREELNYPPFSTLISLVATDINSSQARGAISELAALLRKEIESAGLQIDLLGPAPCVIGRLRGEYRWQLVLKASDQSQALSLLKEFVVGRHTWKGITVDVDPAWML